jgi:prolyl-tRNA synthetase
MLAAAVADRDARITSVQTVDEAVEAAASGFARIPWSAVGEDGEDRLAESAITVRCLQRADGTVPEHVDEPDLVAFVGRSY